MADRGRNKGRRLLALRNIMKSESDPAKLRKLRKEEVHTLADLDNLPAARIAVEKLIEDYPEWPAAFSVAADIACRNGDWTGAERLFSRSADASEASGNYGSALHIRTGPLFRLVEAREDHDECIHLASGRDELSRVLAARTLRRMGKPCDLPETADGFLAARLLVLEEAWRGDGLDALPDFARTWGGPEPEWRWRFIVEGIDIFSEAGMPPDPWKRPVTVTVTSLLDPRFGSERHRLLVLLGRT